LLLKNIQLLKALPYAGVSPFLVCAALLALNITTLPLLGAVQPLVLAYSLAILCFMSGVLWGQYLSGVSNHWNLPVISNAITLIAWLAYSFATPKWYAIILATLFLGLLAIDRELASAHAISQDYLRTRTVVTFLVILSLLVIAYYSI
jgi:Protein of unknown function (DUF3429)